MWIKTSDGLLFNLDTGTCIRPGGYGNSCAEGSVVLELPQRDARDFFLTHKTFIDHDEEVWFVDDHGYINFECKIFEDFGTRQKAQAYIDKLAKKLGAVEI